MAEKRQNLYMAAYCVVVAVLAGAASAVGVLARGDGSFKTVTSVRGVTYEMATSGVYAYNSQQVVAEGVGWDVFTLGVAVPVMLGISLFVRSGSFRGRLFALGMLGYFLYTYLEYALTWAFGPLFPLFVLITAGSLGGLVWLGTNVAREGVAGRFAEDFPSRGFAAVNVTMAALLSLMWIARIAAGLNGDLAGAGLYGETTLVVQALDLGLVVPTALFVSYLTARRTEGGFALAAAYVVAAVAMSAAIVSMMVSASIVHGAVQLPPILIFGIFTVLNALVGVRIYRAVDERSASSRQQMGALTAQPTRG